MGGFFGFMLFIVWGLARKSKAGRCGAFVLFGVELRFIHQCPVPH